MAKEISSQRWNGRTRRLTAWFLAVFVGISGLGHAPGLFSQSAATAKQYYQSGDFSRAERAYKAILPKVQRDKSLTAEYHKNIGICQYMQNNKPAATASFKAAVLANPSISIDASEVLDESVIPFFRDATASTRNTGTAGQGPAPVAPSAVAAKSTQLKIQSNADRAQIMIDGIYAGRVGEAIEADPGQVEITLSAAGFRPAKAGVNIKSKMLNTFRIDLNKLQKAPPPKAKEELTARAKSKSRPKSSNARSGRGDADLFSAGEAPIPSPNMGRDVIGEFEAEAAGAPSAPAYTPPPQTMVAPQMYSPQPYQQMPSVGMPFQPMQAVPVQPMYMQPQPMYMQPQPMYQQPTYPPPSAPAPPPAYTPSDPEDNFADGKSLAKKGKKKKKQSDTEEVNVGISILPLAIGQFYQEKYLLGILFGGAQIGGVTFWYLNSTAADAAFADTQEERDAREVIRNTLGGSDQVAYDAETDAYIEEQNTYIAGLEKNATYGLIGAGVAYITSVLEAILNPPKLKTATKSKANKRYSGFSLNQETTPPSYVYDSTSEEGELDRRRAPPIVNFEVMPIYNYFGHDTSSSFLLQLEYKY